MACSLLCQQATSSGVGANLALERFPCLLHAKVAFTVLCAAGSMSNDSSP
jgi:hypothetical protein